MIKSILVFGALLFCIKSYAYNDFGPSCYHGTKIKHTYYTLCYHSTKKISIWSSYLGNKNFILGSQIRTNDYREDPLLYGRGVDADSYVRSGYDRGHMVPAADMKFDYLSMSETFFMSNMVPQRPSFNRGVWKRLENLVRKWIKSSHQLYIVSGAIVKKSTQRINDKIAIPSYFYKIVYDYKAIPQKMIAFLLPAKQSYRSLKSFVLSVDELEEKTGIDFFYLLDHQTQALESKVDLDGWIF